MNGGVKCRKWGCLGALKVMVNAHSILCKLQQCSATAITAGFSSFSRVRLLVGVGSLVHASHLYGRSGGSEDPNKLAVTVVAAVR